VKFNPLSIFLILAGLTSLIFSGYVAAQEIGAVNRRLAEDRQVQYFFFYPGKMQRISAQYRQLYPQGRLELWRKALGFVGAALFILGAVETGMFTT